MTKKDKRILLKAYETYTKSEIYVIEQAYKKPSQAKIWAFNNVCNYMKDVGGSELKIINHCNMKFTCGFLFEIDGKVYFRYFLPTRTICVSLEELREYALDETYEILMY